MDSKHRQLSSLLDQPLQEQRTSSLRCRSVSAALHCLHQIKEEDGDVAGAAEVLQEVHVETYGALTKKEKADFILEQVNRAH